MNNVHLRKMIAHHMQSIQPFHVMDLLAQARALEAAGQTIVHMEIGEPDFDTPAPIQNAAHNAIDTHKMHYTPALGLPALRSRIAKHYADQFGVALNADRVIITPGASGALLLILGVLLDPGDKVIIADPGYPCNRNFVHLFSSEPVAIPVDSSTNFQLTADHIRHHWDAKTKIVLLASPANPTGSIIPTDELEDIILTTQSLGGIVVIDEIYQGLTYGMEDYTALALSADVFVLNSFSKYYGMTGWRLGWVVAPADFIKPMDNLAQNIFLAASTIAQYAALRAFDEDVRAILEQRRQIFSERRDYLLPALQQLGFRIESIPQGAFYIYSDCGQITIDSQRFCNEVLQQTGVAITPGLDFGCNQPESHIRFAYTTDLENLKTGIHRLRQYIAGETITRA